MDWKTQARVRIQHFKSWKPLICIQGGGARGAWEAGVLAALLDEGMTSEPVAIWGTSAGSINALLASTSLKHAVEENLLNFWIALSGRFIIAAAVIAFLVLGSIGILVEHWSLALIALVVLVLVALMTKWWRPFGIERWPGLIPIRLAAKLLPHTPHATRFVTYFCTANVRLKAAPVAWEWDKIAGFCMRPGSTSAQPIGSPRGESVDPKLAAMCSAALPILIRPLKVADQALLDGGLVANLPAGHIVSQGMSAGLSAICIVPQRLADMKSQDHVDYRLLTFLSDMQRRQKQAREKAKNCASGSYPAHTFAPILLVQPRLNLQSGLLRGLFCPQLLQAEFQQGKQDAERLLSAMARFVADEDEALREHLLDHCEIPEAGQPPRAGWWKCWVNFDWR